MIDRPLIRWLREHFALEWQGIHGAPHWARVRAIGLELAPLTGAHARVVELFAFLHDSQRGAHGLDDGHGTRAAHFVSALPPNWLGLSAAERELLVRACAGHSDGGLREHATVMTCWDADRLDLGRVGIRPDPARLCTDAARDPLRIERCYVRSVAFPHAEPRAYPLRGA